MGVAAHVGSVELDEFGGGDDAVEDGFGDDGVVQGSVPVFGVELAGHDGGSAAFSGGEDVQQFGGGVTGDRGGEEVVEDEKLAGVQAGEERQPLTVLALVDGELVGQVVEAEVSGGAVASAGGVDQRLGKVGLFRRWICRG